MGQIGAVQFTEATLAIVKLIVRTRACWLGGGRGDRHRVVAGRQPSIFELAEKRIWARPAKRPANHDTPVPDAASGCVPRATPRGAGGGDRALGGFAHHVPPFRRADARRLRRRRSLDPRVIARLPPGCTSQDLRARVIEHAVSRPRTRWSEARHGRAPRQRWRPGSATHREGCAGPCLAASSCSSLIGRRLLSPRT